MEYVKPPTLATRRNTEGVIQKMYVRNGGLEQQESTSDVKKQCRSHTSCAH